MQGKRKETANFYRTRIALFQLATKQPPLNGDKAVLSEHASSALQNIVNNWWITPRKPGCKCFSSLGQMMRKMIF